MTSPQATPRTWLARTCARMAQNVAECIALADPSTTPQAVFDALRDAHAALTEARHAADRNAR